MFILSKRSVQIRVESDFSQVLTGFPEMKDAPSLDAPADSFSSTPMGIWDLVGRTPLIPLRFTSENVIIWAKCEFANPSGSIKDRIAAFILADAQKRGLLQPDSIILECSSGNTGVAMAMMGAAKGHPVQILLSRDASQERRWLIEQLGGEVLLFDGSDYQRGIEITQEMAARDKRYFLPRQFENPLNILDHQTTTGPEILTQVADQARQPVALFVAGYGTGGTLAGVGQAIKNVFPSAQIWAMEPTEAALLAGGPSGCHHIEGIADGFIPTLLHHAPLDGHISVSSAEAHAMTLRLQREWGLLVGTSSGGNVAAALRLAKEYRPKGAIVTLLCDRAERYFSTHLFLKNGKPQDAVDTTCIE